MALILMKTDVRLIIAGSRCFQDEEYFLRVINSEIRMMNLMPWMIDEVVSGTAAGPDSIGEVWAVQNNIKVQQFKPHWDEFGKVAGFIRNKEMGDYATHLLAIWDGKSKGTKQMIDYMNSLKKPVRIWQPPEQLKLQLTKTVVKQQFNLFDL